MPVSLPSSLHLAKAGIVTEQSRWLRMHCLWERALRAKLPQGCSPAGRAWIGTSGQHRCS
jgi:hypothetical protein